MGSALNRLTSPGGSPEADEGDGPPRCGAWRHESSAAVDPPSAVLAHHEKQRRQNLAQQPRQLNARNNTPEMLTHRCCVVGRGQWTTRDRFAPVSDARSRNRRVRPAQRHSLLLLVLRLQSCLPRPFARLVSCPQCELCGQRRRRPPLMTDAQGARKSRQHPLAQSINIRLAGHLL